MFRMGRSKPKTEVERHLERLGRLLVSLLEFQRGVSVPPDFMRRDQDHIIGFEHPMAFVWDIQDKAEPALDAVRQFFIEVWATRELALRDASMRTKDPDAWLSSQPSALLAHDLGNALKYPDRKRTPRSGGTVDAHVSISELSAVEEDGQRRARFTFKVIHNGVQHDGYQLAQDTLSAWRSFST